MAESRDSRSENPATSNLKRRTSNLLVLRLSALGDVIHTIPAVMMLREAFSVTWAVEAPYAELVQIVAGVQPVPVRMKKWGRNVLGSRHEIAAAFRGMRGADVAVDFQGLIKSAALAWLSGASDRFGFDRDAIREKAAGVFLNRRVAVDRSQHVIDWNRRLATAVLERAAPWSAAPRRRFPDEGAESGGKPPQSKALRAADWRAFAIDPTGKLGSFTDRIVLLPGAGRPEKLWPVDRFREVARHFGDRALVVWGPAERELATAIGGNAAPETNLRELAFLLSRAACVVGADTGPLHLAAALEVPTIGLYGPTDPCRNGPYGQAGRTISSYETSKSMEAVAARDVIARIEEVVSR